MSKIKVIGITGKKYTGKTTYANAIVTALGTKRVTVEKYSFAKPLKEICHILFGGTEANWYGDFKTERLENWHGVAAVAPGTPRAIMQFVGTELFRDHVHQDFWLLVARAYIADIEKEMQCDVLVIDDVRFDNEALFLKQEYNATIVNLYRPMLSTTDGHRSERGIATNLVDVMYDVTDRENYSKYANDIIARIGA